MTGIEIQCNSINYMYMYMYLTWVRLDCING